jgi:hypothetical protein
VLGVVDRQQGGACEIEKKANTRVVVITTIAELGL